MIMFLRKPLPGDAGILEQIADAANPKYIPPALPSVLRGIVQHMAALTECLKVDRRVVGRIVIEVRTGKDDVGDSNLS
jgi:hypothetical protein